MKLLLPDMLQVTSVCPPACGAKVTSDSLVARNGLRNSRRVRTSSGARRSVLGMLPSPTCLFPDHRCTAPTPAGGPS